ncbi:hypothetical protein [Rhizobium lentis]|uniref:hypothetical protein n=1 Tax=Rhizobium lentis TaxID=1138194 RepID=UPI001C8366E7|nr:hypothetical protein [Rhizobium lentis]
MGEITVVHDISHGLKANQQTWADGLRRRDTEKMRQLGLNRCGEEADRAPGRDQSFEVNGKIAASVNIGSDQRKLFANHLIIEGEDLQILLNPVGG